MIWRVRARTREDTHLVLELHKDGHLVRKHRLDTPADRGAHLVRVVDGPHADLLAGLARISEELLPLSADEHGKVEREALARVPEVRAREGWRQANVIPAQAGQVSQRGADEDGVPEAEDETGREQRLPVVVGPGVSAAERELSLDDLGHGGLLVSSVATHVCTHEHLLGVILHLAVDLG